MIRYKSFNDVGLIAPSIGAARNQFYVDYTYGSDQNPGTKERPFKTCDYAIGRCSVSGDTIYLMPGHAESLASAGALDIDVAGVTIIGLGYGTDIPTFTFTGGASTDDIDIDASNVTLKNIKFANANTDLACMFDVNDGDFTMEDCILEGTTGTSGVINFINLATTKDNFTFKRCKFINLGDPLGTDDAASTGCFYFVDSENIFIEDCYFYGYFETAIFHNKTTAAKNVWTRNCYGSQLLSGAEVYKQVANMIGGDVGSLFLLPNVTVNVEGNSWGTLSARFALSPQSAVACDGTDGHVGTSGNAGWAT
jgi:hypothetical protein